MLKAIYHSQYRKKGTGDTIYVYAVTGTTIEVTDYLAIQEGANAKPAGTWPKADNGAPLYWVNADAEKRNASMAKQSYNLIFNRDKTKVIRDDSAAQLAAAERITSKKEDKLADYMAQIELGLITLPTRGNSNMRVVATPQAAQLVDSTKRDLTDEIINAIGDAEGGEKEPVTPATITSGTEDLGE